MSDTYKNLMAAFAGESQANRKYLAFAKQAEKEGYNQVAKLFRAAAEAETIHAHSHLKAAGEIGSTTDNLKAAVTGETYEFESMYPPMISQAQSDGNKAAEQSFTYANEVEKVHADLYNKALENLENPDESDYFVCPVCGYTCAGHHPDKCPVCDAAGKTFIVIK